MIYKNHTEFFENCGYVSINDSCVTIEEIFRHFEARIEAKLKAQFKKGLSGVLAEVSEELIG